MEAQRRMLRDDSDTKLFRHQVNCLLTSKNIMHLWELLPRVWPSLGSCHEQSDEPVLRTESAGPLLNLVVLRVGVSGIHGDRIGRHCRGEAWQRAPAG